MGKGQSIFVTSFEGHFTSGWGVSLTTCYLRVIKLDKNLSNSYKYRSTQKRDLNWKSAKSNKFQREVTGYFSQNFQKSGFYSTSKLSKTCSIMGMISLAFLTGHDYRLLIWSKSCSLTRVFKLFAISFPIFYKKKTVLLFNIALLTLSNLFKVMVP